MWAANPQPTLKMRFCRVKPPSLRQVVQRDCRVTAGFDLSLSPKDVVRASAVCTWRLSGPALSRRSGVLPAKKNGLMPVWEAGLLPIGDTDMLPAGDRRQYIVHALL